MTDQKREPRTSWGEPIRSVYGPEDVPAERLAQDLG